MMRDRGDKGIRFKRRLAGVGKYYLNIAPSATARELHASIGGPSGANRPSPGDKGDVPAGFDNKEKYGIYLYFRMGHISLGEANLIYAGMVNTLGKDIVEAAAEKVRTAEKMRNNETGKRDFAV